MSLWTPLLRLAALCLRRPGVTALLALCALTSCYGPRSPRDGAGEDLIGEPPPAEHDPFASQVRPPDSARAPTSGTFDIAPSDSSALPEPASVIEAEPIPLITPPRAQGERASGEEPPKLPHKCFSCVQICPLSDRSGDCSQSREDVICGWGTSPTETEAQRVARAECDATLDMAREMPRFSRIEGACPEARCAID